MNSEQSKAPRPLLGHVPLCGRESPLRSSLRDSQNRTQTSSERRETHGTSAKARTDLYLADADSALSAKSIPGLDGLRAVSILIVMASHSGLQKVVPGVFGVTIFFFISGFIITNLLLAELRSSARINIRLFYARRALRLYPPLLVYLATVCIVLLLSGRVIDRFGLIAALFYFANYVYAFAPSHLDYFGVHLWSLAVEEHFYLVFPALFLLLSRWGNPIPAMIALSVAALVCRASLSQTGTADTVYVTVASECRMDSILMGAITAVAINSRFAKGLVRCSTSPLSVASAALIILATLAYRNEVFRDTVRFTLQNAALIPLVVSAVFTSRYLPVKRVLNHPIARWTGIWSYSLYLWHYPLFQLAEQRISLPKPAVYATAWLASFAVAAGIYFVLERPLFRLRERFGSRTHERFETSSEAT